MQAKAIRELIEEARQAATFESARFSAKGLDKVDEYSNEIREATRIYRETWILPYLEQALELLDGKRIPYQDRLYTH